MFAQPQEKTITGKVVLNDLSEPAVGAVVQEKGTNNASATSTGGQFSLKVSNTPATLVVSYMGYKTQEVVVKGGSVEVVLDSVMQSYISGFIYSALIDSFCSEQNARMTAMDSANKNADKLLSELSLKYNRQRQAQITQEITEISAGARAQRQTRKRKEGVL